MSDYLAIYLSNDPGTQDYLHERAREQIEEWETDGLDFDGLSEAIRQAHDPGEWEDYVYDWAVMYTEHQDAESLAGEVFAGDWDDAQRYMANRYREAIEFALPFDPQQLFEWGHPDMPRDEWGGEPDIPERPYWWMNNPDAQVALVEAQLAKAAKNPPRRNPAWGPLAARENFTAPEHRIMAEEYDAQIQYVDAIGERAAGRGDHKTDEAIQMQTQLMRGYRNAHEESAKSFHPIFAEASATTERYREASGNPPAQWVEKWIHHTSGSHQGQYVRAVGRPVALQTVTPYTPRSGAPGTREDAKDWGWVYEQEQGRKVPKGTKYLLIDQLRRSRRHYLGKTTAHKTVKAAKAAADKSLGLSPKRNKPKSSRSSSYAVQVRKSKGAKPTKVKLPKSAGAHRVNGKIVHRAVSYAGGKLKLLKGWTVSTLAGLGIAKFKTKAAAVRHAKK